jgi:photosystem II stability/assembly factor-like uncharacterized protein
MRTLILTALAAGAVLACGGAAPPAGTQDVLVVVDGAMPTGQWFNATGNLAGMASECGNVSFMSSRPDTDVLITGVALHGLWSSTNGGASWSPMGAGAGSAMITNRISSILFDPANPMTFWESGIYNGPGVYRTTDGGATFAALGNAHHNDAVSVDFTDPMRRTLLAGGHEMARTVYRSTDGGGTWTNIGMNLPGNAGTCTQPLALDGQTYLVGCFDYGSPGSIVRTTDGGANWTIVYPSPVSSSRPLVASDGAIYWSRSGDHGLVKSTDRGQTWTELPSPGNFGSLAPVALPGGRIAAFGPRGIMVSADGGTTWNVATPPVPFSPHGITYAATRRAFFAWHFSCDNTVPADAIAGFAYQ